MANVPDHERFCAEIERQTGLFRRALAAGGPPALTARVPSCPDWSLRELAVHLGGAHRWVEEIARTRALTEPAEEEVPGYGGPGRGGRPADDPAEDLAELDRWLMEGAALLVAALRDTGPEVPVWSWSPRRNTGFWARRMTHETVVHRLDACLTTDAEFTLAPDLAADGLDEWLDILRFATAPGGGGSDEETGGDGDEDARALRARAGATLHLHATDTSPQADAEWLIELTSGGVEWRRAHGRAAVALRGPVADLFGVLNRRLPVDGPNLEVLGEAELLAFWLRHTSWG